MEIARSGGQMQVQMLFWKLMVYFEVEQVQSIQAHPILASGFGANPCYVRFPSVHSYIYDFDSQLGWRVHYFKCVH